MPRVKATRGMLGASVGMQADSVVSRVWPAALADRPTQISLGSGSGGPTDGSSGPQAIEMPFAAFSGFPGLIFRVYGCDLNPKFQNACTRAPCGCAGTQHRRPRGA
jgi:hypothetical protein